MGLMSSGLDKSWSVLTSYETVEGNRCVDIFSRPNGTFGFEEFHKDPEDMEPPISYFSGHDYPTEIAAIRRVARPYSASTLRGSGARTHFPHPLLSALVTAAASQ